MRAQAVTTRIPKHEVTLVERAAEALGHTRSTFVRKAVVGGDESAWKRLYTETYGPLYRYVQWRCGSQHDVIEEVLGETWMTAVRRIRHFQPVQASFLHWTRGIAANVLKNYLRREQTRRRHVQPLAEEPTGNESATARLETRERVDRIIQALSLLPDHYEQVLRAKAADGLSVAQIAESRSESPKAVESLLSRARQAFRKEFQP